MRKLLLAALALVLTGLAVGVGLVLTESEDEQEPEATSLDTSLDDVDTSTMVVRRTSFCADVAEADVAEALGGEAQRATSYDNGEPAPLTPTLTDVAHEYACAWTGQGGTSAAAWVFAPPVTQQGARNLLTEVPQGCRTVASPEFGSPSDALLCQNGRSVTLRGLFGDAWLTCQLVGERGEARAELIDRAGRWCVAVATAAG